MFKPYWSLNSDRREWNCPHGVGHGDWRMLSSAVHGCDGCCGRKDFPPFKGKEVVLLNSGGLDSLVTAAILDSQGWNIHSLFINYGQKARNREILAAHKIQNAYGVCDDVEVVKLDLPFLRSNVMLGSPGDSVISPDLDEENTDCSNVIVPVRNVIFMSIAASYAETKGIMFLGVGYDGPVQRFGEADIPDVNHAMCKYFEVVTGYASYGSAADLQILAPLIKLDKSEIMDKARELDVDFSIFYSCFSGAAKPCLKCAKCQSYLLEFGDEYPFTKSG